MRSRSMDSRRSRCAIGLAVALAAFAFGTAGWAVAADEQPGVTDLSGADPSSILSDDITEALAVPRGTRIQPHARPTVRLPIYFEFNSAELRPDAQELLSRVTSAIESEDLDGFRFSVEGHTDNVGTENYNRSLSVERAAAVKSFLLERGVQSARLETIGHGEDAPVASNDAESGRQRNRRVELINLGGAP